jgi:hypothetical protein
MEESSLNSSPPGSTAEPQSQLQEESSDQELENDDEVEIRPYVKEDREAIKQLLDSFDDKQLHRYEAFRRAKFSRVPINH